VKKNRKNNRCYEPKIIFHASFLGVKIAFVFLTSLDRAEIRRNIQSVRMQPKKIGYNDQSLLLCWYFLMSSP